MIGEGCVLNATEHLIVNRRSITNKININKATIAGRLVRDPELKALPSGSAVVSFSVAVNRVYTDKDKKKVESTEFMNVVAFGKTAENINTYFTKGQEIYVEGRIQTRSWEHEGKKNYRTEIVLDQFQFVGSKGSKTEQKNTAPTEKVETADEGVNISTDDIDPDSIPF